MYTNNSCTWTNHSGTQPTYFLQERKSYVIEYRSPCGTILKLSCMQQIKLAHNMLKIIKNPLIIGLISIRYNYIYIVNHNKYLLCLLEVVFNSFAVKACHNITTPFCSDAVLERGETSPNPPLSISG